MFPTSSRTATLETQASTIAFKKLSDSLGLTSSLDFAVSLVRSEMIEGDKLSALDRHLGGPASNLVWDLINIVLVRLFGRLPMRACSTVVMHPTCINTANVQNLIASELGSLGTETKDTTPSTSAALPNVCFLHARLSELS